ncbi:phospholipase [Aliishimia ponticola]|uniref:Phospholipase D n=1 Tax=Aliishimia ponticola TaxID=2499833 RepID=A0A4S4NF48_9RHOB|nr:phospholipase D-like domain-containing protein [Aliishimia ponticola]THH38139.1 phospholipase [Aliishimia ponticola]
MTEILLTAEEAYPAFETLVAEAEREVLISMRLFDPRTRLRKHTDLGQTWNDLIAHKLSQGIDVDVTITDFDPVARPELHRYSWECLAELNKLQDTGPGKIRARVHMHPARAGWLYSLALRATTRQKIADECARLNDLPPQERDRQLAHMPEFRKLIREGGSLAPKRWPPASLRPASHHQKMAVIDGKALYVGGLDLNPRRYDTLDHDRVAQQTWHDIQVIVRDARAKAGRDHILKFRQETEGTPPGQTAGLLRTLSRRQRSFARRIGPTEVLREIEDTLLEMFRAARSFIYVETQFLRSSVITEALVAAAGRGVDLIVILPAAPEDVAFEDSSDLDARFGEQLQVNAVKALRAAYGERLFLGAPAQPSSATTPDNRDSLGGAEIIYVHAKAVIVDGAAALVSSANLNGRSMRWDTETGVQLEGEEAQTLFDRCCAHWFCDAPPSGLTTAAAWDRAAAANLAQRPEDRSHFILPYDPQPAAEMGQHLPGAPEELV